MLSESLRRIKARPHLPDPLRGDEASPLRIKVSTPLPDLPVAFVPRTMVDDPAYPTVLNNEIAWKKLRCRHDFEYWCVECCTIKHKITGADVAFRLNAPQRRLLAAFEEDRLADRPIRLILLKARQWGGSTLIQTYMAWIQLCHCRNWNSIICSQVKDTSAGIRGMFSKLLDNYPPDIWDGDEPPRFRPYERSQNVREIAGRGCRVTVSSIENQDSVRGADFAMAHLSETAFWRPAPTHTPEDLIRAVCGSIALVPNSFVAMESTANGVGNYFHREWMRCRDGNGDKRALFVPWYEIEIYRLPPDDPEELIRTLTPYERMLWDRHGCALDQINWYRMKLREYPSHSQMMAEFPTTDTEAFVNTGTGLFGREHVELLRLGCHDPIDIGEIVRQELPPSAARLSFRDNALYRFVSDSAGNLKVWQHPEENAEYVVSVDIGGRTARSDWSVVAVVKNDPKAREVVAQWRGHIDHDRLAQIAADIGNYYNEALLVVESNTLEHTGAGMFIIKELTGTYTNLYFRKSARAGFHTNAATKEMIVTGLMAAVRDGTYIERDSDACDEMLTFEQSPDGSYGAKPGNHDDILISRAIALYIASSLPPPPSFYGL